jgi:hypothetical protein
MMDTYLFIAVPIEPGLPRDFGATSERFTPHNNFFTAPTPVCAKVCQRCGAEELRSPHGAWRTSAPPDSWNYPAGGPKKGAALGRLLEISSPPPTQTLEKSTESQTTISIREFVREQFIVNRILQQRGRLPDEAEFWLTGIANPLERWNVEREDTSCSKEYKGIGASLFRTISYSPEGTEVKTTFHRPLEQRWRTAGTWRRESV